MKNKRECAILLSLATLIILVIAFPIVRQNRLNRHLQEAIQPGADASVIKDLIKQGADPNAVVTDEYDVPLFRAVGIGSLGAVQALLESGASVKQVGPGKCGPIFAFNSNNPWTEKINEAEYRAIINQLQRSGESIEERDVLGFTPLMRSVWSGNVILTKTLLDLGANRNVTNNLGQTVASWTGNIPPNQAALEKLLNEHN